MFTCFSSSSLTLRTFVHVDHECRIAADPMTAAAAQGPNRVILMADQITAFLLGGGADGRSEVALDGSGHAPVSP